MGMAVAAADEREEGKGKEEGRDVVKREGVVADPAVGEMESNSGFAGGVVQENGMKRSPGGVGTGGNKFKLLGKVS